MSIVHQVLGPYDIDEVYAFAHSRLTTNEPDEQERMFKSWSVKWRKEALEHYLKLGWSFIARREGRVVGFFLAQPFLFFRGQTQTLWVEHVEAEDDDVTHALIDVAVRVAREKHLQRVLISEASTIAAAALKPWHPEPLEQDIVIVKTTKG